MLIVQHHITGLPWFSFLDLKSIHSPIHILYPNIFFTISLSLLESPRRYISLIVCFLLHILFNRQKFLISTLPNYFIVCPMVYCSYLLWAHYCGRFSKLVMNPIVFRCYIYCLDQFGFVTLFFY